MWNRVADGGYIAVIFALFYNLFQSTEEATLESHPVLARVNILEEYSQALLSRLEPRLYRHNSFRGVISLVLSIDSIYVPRL